MGKASRRLRHQQAGNPDASAKPLPAPFVRRPFEGLAGETDWVAMREIVPAATASVRLRTADGSDAPPNAGPASTAGSPEVVVATVLPMAWPGLRRADGALMVGLQTATAGSDRSRDVAKVILELLDTVPGTPLRPGLPATADTPRLQDLLDADAPFEVTVHEGFDFWVAEGAELDQSARESLQQANDSMVPTEKLGAAPSAYWCRVGDRTHLRWILPDDEDAATDALARLHAAGADLLGERTRLLGAFRACGLLAPVWDLDPELPGSAYEKPLAALAKRYGDAVADGAPLTSDQRRARSGLLSRQLTLR